MAHHDWKIGLLAGSAALALAACTSAAGEDSPTAAAEIPDADASAVAEQVDPAETDDETGSYVDENYFEPPLRDDERPLYDLLQGFEPEVEGYAWASEFGADAASPYASTRVGADDVATEVTPAECGPIVAAFALQSTGDADAGADDLRVDYGGPADLDHVGEEGPGYASLSLRVMDEAELAEDALVAVADTAGCDMWTESPPWGGTATLSGVERTTVEVEGADGPAVRLTYAEAAVLEPEADEPETYPGDGSALYAFAYDRYLMTFSVYLTEGFEDPDATATGIFADFVAYVDSAQG